VTTLRRNSSRSAPRKDKQPRRETLLQAGGIVVLLALGMYIAITSYSGVPLRKYDKAYAIVPNVGNLILHDQVRIGGVRVGQIAGLDITHDGKARLTLQLDKGTDLPKDTSIAIRANGLLGARYVQLVPGSSHTLLPNDATLKANADALTFGLPETLDTFDKPTRAALGTDLRELGAGVLGRGQQLNDMLRVFAPALPHFRSVVGAIESRPGAVERLVPSLNETTQALNTNHVPIGEGFAPTAAALEPLVDHRADTQATLDAAPPALTATNQGLGEGIRLLAATRTLLDQANLTLPPAPAGLHALAGALRSAPEPLRRTDSLLQAAQPAIPGLLKITDAAAPLLQPLRQGLDSITTAANKIAPYDCDIVNFGVTFRSMTGFGGTSGPGPAGLPMAFRLQAVPPLPAESLRIPDPTAVLQREGYPPPCKFASTTYPTLPVKVP
jgi:phospholipid/cholesterol/gamma-HCH transport system substrate-binding protein